MGLYTHTLLSRRNTTSLMSNEIDSRSDKALMI